MIHHGDLFAVLPTLDEASIDACVTDPPYGIAFMNKAWDNFSVSAAAARIVPNRASDSANPNLHGRTRSPASSPSAVEYNRSLQGQRAFQDWTERWACEVLRVLKPGAYVVVCGAPRSYHRMACGLEDAGFVVRDCFAWLFGQGFPKSLNLGDGKGTALKPAYEPIVLAWKPCEGSITSTHATYGTAALNIDACRIDANGETWDREPDHVKPSASIGTFQTGTRSMVQHDLGRWPANVCLDEAAATQLDAQTGELTSGDYNGNRQSDKTRNVYGAFTGVIGERAYEANSSGASRFYYVAKPSREERDYGCDGLPRVSAAEITGRKEGSAGLQNPRAGVRAGSMDRDALERAARNTHPTVKPIELMRWLVKLVTPINGTVLDPFMGSGTTGMACRYEQRAFVGIEREAAYVEIATRRIAAVTPLFAEAPQEPATRLQQEALPLLS